MDFGGRWKAIRRGRGRSLSDGVGRNGVWGGSGIKGRCVGGWVESAFGGECDCDVSGWGSGLPIRLWGRPNSVVTCRAVLYRLVTGRGSGNSPSGPCADCEGHLVTMGGGTPAVSSQG